MSSGFCPGCVATEVEARVVGENLISFTEGADEGDVATTLTFLSPLQGTWSEAGSIANLTPTIRCPR